MDSELKIENMSLGVETKNEIKNETKVETKNENEPPKFSPENAKNSFIQVIQWYLGKTTNTKGQKNKSEVVINLFDFIASHMEMLDRDDFKRFKTVVIQKVASFMNDFDRKHFPDGYLEKQFKLFGGGDEELEVLEKHRKNFDFGKVYYKVLRKDLTHNGYTYKEGLNVDPIPFNPHGSCKPGGLYFSDKENILQFFSYGTCLATIKVPEDAKVYNDGENKWKSDRLVVEKIVPISKSELWENYNFCKRVVQKDGKYLKYVLEQKEELCKLAVENNGCSIKYVHDQTDELCKIALQEDGHLIRYIHNQTEPFCELAVKQSPYAIKYIHKQTDKIRKLAVEKSGYTLQYIHDQTEDICELAVQRNPLAIKYVHNQTPKICELAVTRNVNVLPYIHDKTELIRILVDQTVDNSKSDDQDCDESDDE